MDYAEITIVRARGLLTRDATRPVAPLTAQSAEIFVVAKAIDLKGDHRTETQLMEQNVMSPKDIMKRRIEVENNPDLKEPKLEVFRTPKTEEAGNPTFNTEVTKFMVPVDQFPIAFECWSAPFVTSDSRTPYVGHDWLDDDDDVNHSNTKKKTNVVAGGKRFSRTGSDVSDFFKSTTTNQLEQNDQDANNKNQQHSSSSSLHHQNKRELFLGRGVLTEEDLKSTRARSVLDGEIRLELQPRPNEDDPVIIDANESMPTGLGLLVVNARLVPNYAPPPTKEELEFIEKERNKTLSKGLIPITVPKLDILSPKPSSTLPNKVPIPRPTIDGLEEMNEEHSMQLARQKNGETYSLHPAQMIEITIQNCPSIIHSWIADRTAQHSLNCPGAPPPPAPQRFEILVETFHGMNIFSSGPIAVATVFEFERQLEERNGVFRNFSNGSNVDDSSSDDDDNDNNDDFDDDPYRIKVGNNKNNNKNKNGRQSKQQSSSALPSTSTTFSLFSIYGSLSAPIGSELPFKIRFVDCNKRLERQAEREELQKRLSAGNNNNNNNNQENDFMKMQGMSINFPKRTAHPEDEPELDEDGRPLYLKDVFAESTSSAKLLVPHPEQHSMSPDTVNDIHLYNDNNNNNNNQSAVPPSLTSIPIRLIDRDSRSFYGKRLSCDVKVKPVLFIPAKSVTESHLFRGKGIMKIEVREVRDLICGTLKQFMLQRQRWQREKEEYEEKLRTFSAQQSQSTHQGGARNSPSRASFLDVDDDCVSVLSGKTSGTARSHATSASRATRMTTNLTATSSRFGGTKIMSTRAGLKKLGEEKDEPSGPPPPPPPPMKPEPIFCEVAIKDKISDKTMKVIGKSPVVLPEEDAFFGFTTTVELEQINQLPEAIVVSIFQGHTANNTFSSSAFLQNHTANNRDIAPNCIARSVINVLDRRHIDGTWVTLKPAVNKKTGQEDGEGLKGMAWVRWVASCRDTTVANEIERDRRQAVKSQQHHHNQQQTTSMWIQKDTLIPDLLKSANAAAMGAVSGNLRNSCQLLRNFDHQREMDSAKEKLKKKEVRRNRTSLDDSSFLINNENNNDNDDHNTIKNGNTQTNNNNTTVTFLNEIHHHDDNENNSNTLKPIKRRHYEEAGALAVDWNAVPIGHALKISQNGKTLFGPSLRVNSSEGHHIRVPPIIIYVDTPQEGPLLFECFRGPEFGQPLIVHQNDRIYDKKCWLPVDTPLSEDERLQERIIDEDDSDEESERRRRASRKKRAQHPPCFTVALDEIAAIRVPCRWVPLYKRFPPQDTNADDEDDDWIIDPITGKRYKKAKNGQGGVIDPEELRREQEEAAAEALRNKKKPPMLLKIIGPAFPALHCQLDEETDTLEKIIPQVERHFGVPKKQQIFHHGKIRIMTTGRPQPPSSPNGNKSKTDLAGFTSSMRVRIKREEDKFNPDTFVTELILSNRDARAFYITVKLPQDTCGGIVMPMAVPHSCTIGLLRQLIREQIVERKLVNPETNEFLFDLFNYEKVKREKEEAERKERERIEKERLQKEKEEEEERKKKEQEEKDKEAGVVRKIQYNIRDLFKPKEKKVKVETEAEKKERLYKERLAKPPPPLSEVNFVVTRLVHFNKILRDEAAVRNVGIRIESPVLAILADLKKEEERIEELRKSGLLDDVPENNNNNSPIGGDTKSSRKRSLSSSMGSLNQQKQQRKPSLAMSGHLAANKVKDRKVLRSSSKSPTKQNQENQQPPKIKSPLLPAAAAKRRGLTLNTSHTQSPEPRAPIAARLAVSFSDLDLNDSANDENSQQQHHDDDDDQETRMLKEQLKRLNNRIYELESTSQRQQELLRRVATKM